MFQAAHFATDPRGLRVDGRVHNVRYFSSSLSKVLQKLFRLPTDLLGLLPARSHAYAVLWKLPSRTHHPGRSRLLKPPAPASRLFWSGFDRRRASERAIGRQQKKCQFEGRTTLRPDWLREFDSGRVARFWPWRSDPQVLAQDDF